MRCSSNNHADFSGQFGFWIFRDSNLIIIDNNSAGDLQIVLQIARTVVREAFGLPSQR